MAVKEPKPEPLSNEAHEGVMEFLRSMSREELIEFMERREPGVPEYWLGKPVPPPRFPGSAKNGHDSKP